MSHRSGRTGAPVRDTGWWYGMVVVTLVFGGLGVLLQSPAIVLCAGLGIVYAGYGQFDGDPGTGDDLRLTRELGDSDTPADDVAVTVSVTNTGDSFVPHLRLVDGVPTALTVFDGTPRCGTALRPGETVEFEYTVAVARGTHEWEPATVVLGNRSGSKERQTTLAADTTLERSPPDIEIGSVPVRGMTNQYAGRVRTDSGGNGIDFHSIRRYRHGDPLDRIDWNRFARTGELSTVQFTEERGVSVVLLIDARKAAYYAFAPDATHAVDRSVYAAGRILSSLLDNGDRAGIAIFGREDAWLAPGAGDKHRARARHLLTEHPALSSTPPEQARYRSFLEERRDELLEERIERLHRRVPSDAQVFCFSPCCDDYVVTVADYLDAHGHLVTVVSPDPTASDTPGRYIARLARHHRLGTLNRIGIPVVDWRSNEPIEAAFARTAAEEIE